MDLFTQVCTRSVHDSSNVCRVTMTAMLESSRTDLSRRIHRSVLVLERYKRAPSRREAYYVLLAIECLRDGRFGDGAEAMNAAERVDAIPMTVSDMPGLHDDMTAADLRNALRCVLRTEG